MWQEEQIEKKQLAKNPDPRRTGGRIYISVLLCNTIVHLLKVTRSIYFSYYETKC